MARVEMQDFLYPFPILILLGTVECLPTEESIKGVFLSNLQEVPTLN